MTGAAIQIIAPLIVFSMIIVRETVSYLLALFPGKSVLWSLSFALGYDFVHVQMAMDEWIGLGYAGNVTALLLLAALLIYGYRRRNSFILALLCHLTLIGLALFAVRGWAAGSGVLFSGANAKGILFCALLAAAAAGCVHAHMQYIRGIRTRAAR